MHVIAWAGDATGSLPGRCAALGQALELRLADWTVDSLREALRPAGCAVVEARPGGALQAAQRVRQADPAVQVVVMVEPDRRAQVERTLLFTPGLGEVWLVEPEQLTEDLVNRAAAVTRQRREYARTRTRVRQEMAKPKPQARTRTQISDAYLAALLQVLPDPVISLDEEDRVLSWSPAAERSLGHPASTAVGQRIRDLLDPVDAPALERLLEHGRDGARKGELRLRGPMGVRVVEAAVVPVDAGGHRVRSLVLHDLTREREAQTELEIQAGELEAQASQLQEQAAEMELLNTELQERTDELEKAVEARSRFYAAMSHELRTPINAVVGYNSLLLDGLYGALGDTQLEALQRSQRAAKHLLELVNDVLDLSKIEAGRIVLEPEDTDFPSVLEEILHTVGPLAEEHGCEMVLDPGPPLTLVTDARRLRQILLNLLSNAIKFGAGRPVRLVYRAGAAGGVEIEVQDQGPGIAPEQQERIFDEFVQLDGQREGGTGLGLPISRRLAELLGGSLQVDSRLGQGSTFRLSLPAFSSATAAGDAL